MNRILLVIGREFITRTRKKSFWVMAVLGPVLFVLGMVVPLWVGSFQSEQKVIEVVDHSGYFQYKFASAPDISFAYFNGDIPGRINNFLRTEHYAILYIPRDILESGEGAVIYSRSQVSPDVTVYLEKNLNLLVASEKLKQSGVDEALIRKIEKERVNISTENILKQGSREGETEASLVVALFSAILILFFIVLYGGQVMRGVIEEKTNRIIEVIISSVRPFELMMGKITGIALVSMAQFAIWAGLTAGVSFLIHQKYGKALDLFSDEKIEQTLRQNPQLDVAQAVQVNKIAGAIESIDFTYLLSVFLFYFIGGYLLFASLFAGIGSMVDTETDTQQFVFPLIAPLMFVIVMATSIISDPHSSLAFWLSVIPFTSPVAMMLRLPFDVPLQELLISMLMLFVTFLLCTWISAKVYRVGILMYGKKMSLAEVWRQVWGDDQE